MAPAEDTSSMPETGPAPASAEPRRTAILVLGMHRSGTSALTRVISILGADLPSNLMPAVPGNNETGFWESMDVYGLNDELLLSAGSSWDDWRRFNPDWYRSPVEPGFMRRALAFIDRDFSDSAFFVLKDPRISRILPFWIRVLEQRDIDPLCVIAVRNPLEVAASLRKRDGFSAPKSLMLWLRHMLDAELATRSTRRSFVAYDGLLADWRQSVTTTSKALEFGWPGLSAKAELEVDRFLDDRFRHHSQQADDLYTNMTVSDWVKSAYAIFLKLCGGAATSAELDALDALRAEFERASHSLGAVVFEAEVAEEQATQRTREFDDERTALQSELEQKIAYTKELKQDLSATHARETEVGQILAQHDGRVQELEQRLGEAYAKMAEVDRALELRDAWLKTLERELKATHASAAELGRVLDQRNEQIASLGPELFATHAKAEEVGLTLAMLNARVAEFKSNLEKKRLLYRELEADRDQQAAHYHQARSQQHRLAHTLNADHAGAAWQLARPLRTVERRLPRLLRATAALPKVLWWAVSFQLPERLRLRRRAQALMSSGLFDENWYVETYPDVVLGGFRPIIHWMLYGCREGRFPNRLFDTAWYLSRNPIVATQGVDPVLHYLEDGARAGLQPHPGFDTHWYLRQNPDVARAGMNPLVHYLTIGAAEGRAPVPPRDAMLAAPGGIESVRLVEAVQVTEPSQGRPYTKPDSAKASGSPVPVDLGDSSSGNPEAVPVHLAEAVQVTEPSQGRSFTKLDGAKASGSPVPVDAGDSSSGNPEAVPVQRAVPPWDGDWATLTPLPNEHPRRILVVDWKTPTPDLDSGSYRITKFLKCLIGSGLAVDFIADREAEHPRYAADLVHSGVNLIVGYDAAIEHLRAHGSDFCAAILSRPEVAERYLAIVRAFAIQARVIYDTVDLHWVRFARSVKDADNPAELLALSERYKRLELANARASDVTVAITEEERQLLLAEDANLTVAIIPNIHESVATVPAFETRHGLFFIGGFDHSPNIDAMHYFVGQVFPLIANELDDVKLYIVGSKMPESIRTLASPKVAPIGFVEDVRPFFEMPRIFVAPLRHGAGMKGKIGQSLSFGLPVVTTSVGAEGIGLESGRNAYIADTAEEFAAKVVKLYRDKELWEQFSKAGQDLIAENFSESVVKKQILSLLDGSDDSI